MENIGLHYCFKFEKNLTVFGGVMAKKQPKSIQKWYFLLAWKYLKIHNLATKNAIVMKLTRIMDLHETFHLAQNWGLTHRGQVGTVKKKKKVTKFTNFQI